MRFRDCLFTPLVTLWTFLLQVLSPDGSCREAVCKPEAGLGIPAGPPGGRARAELRRGAGPGHGTLHRHAELDLRSIKQTMNLSVLRCKPPAMVRKEIRMHWPAYNLVPTLMAQAAQQAGIEPRQISFAGAVQTINAMTPFLQLAQPGHALPLTDFLLRALARHRVGNRPDRYEPRAVKRRAKPIAYLTIPRQEARRRLETHVITKR